MQEMLFLFYFIHSVIALDGREPSNPRKERDIVHSHVISPPVQKDDSRAFSIIIATKTKYELSLSIVYLIEFF
jgi:hypothetical protein